jgi:hypothetical protein
MMKCPQCGGGLEPVRNDGALNSDQFDSVKAGDWYCPTCPDNGRGKYGGCYFWEREVQKKPEEEIVYWSCDDAAEQLYHDDPDDAVEEFIDDFLDPKMTPAEVLEAIPAEIDVYGYARMKPSISEETSLEHLLEVLDEEYGDPDDSSTEPTPAMLAAEKQFHEAVLREYESWACKKVCTKTVDSKEWIQKNRPDWLE